jgi:hypothetical protein
MALVLDLGTTLSHVKSEVRIKWLGESINHRYSAKLLALPVDVSYSSSVAAPEYCHVFRRRAGHRWRVAPSMFDTDVRLAWSHTCMQAGGNWNLLRLGRMRRTILIQEYGLAGLLTDQASEGCGRE